MPVREPARGDEWHAQALPCAAEEDEVRDVGFADVTRALEAVDGEEVDAQANGGLGVADGGAFMQDGAACGFELFDYGAGAVAGCFDDADAAVYYGLGVAWW